MARITYTEADKPTDARFAGVRKVGVKMLKIKIMTINTENGPRAFINRFSEIFL